MERIVRLASSFEMGECAVQDVYRSSCGGGADPAYLQLLVYVYQNMHLCS